MPRNKGRLILVRHGQTFANVDRVWHGSTDTPLTPLGLQQAQKLGQYFHKIAQPHHIYASPLQRAHNTAKAISGAFDLTISLDPRLQEFCVGQWEGLPYDTIDKEHDRERKLHRDPDFAPPGGESQNVVRIRVIAALEEILLKHPEETVVVVSHGVAIGIALSHYLHRDTSRWFDYSHQNTGYSELCTTEKKLLFFNQAAHLV